MWVALLLREDGARLCHGANVGGVDGEDAFKGVQGALAIIHSTLKDADPKPDGLFRAVHARGEGGVGLNRGLEMLRGVFVVRHDACSVGDNRVRRNALRKAR